jgi:hypothetical protein
MQLASSAEPLFTAQLRHHFLSIPATGSQSLTDCGRTLLGSFTVLFGLELHNIRLDFSSTFLSDFRQFLFVSCIAYVFTLKMEMIYLSEKIFCEGQNITTYTCCTLLNTYN